MKKTEIWNIDYFITLASSLEQIFHEQNILVN